MTSNPPDKARSLLYGPVPSRRLGRSLGIDLVPFKTCSYDCIYCQLGRTTNKTLERKAWVPLEGVFNELEDRLSGRPDYITLGGSGEPTLHSKTGELISRIKDMTRIPVAVLTNGSLLWQKEVRAQLMNADLVLPSLDAGDEETFRLVNRPHADLSLEKVLDGLLEFRREFRGEYWLEVFLLDAHVSNRARLDNLIECVDRIKPDRVQLNTVARPPAEKSATGVAREKLEELAALFYPRAEVIAEFAGIQAHPDFSAGRRDILEMLRRRPCSREDIANGLGMHPEEITKYLTMLTNEGLIDKQETKGRTYYFAASAVE